VLLWLYRFRLSLMLAGVGTLAGILRFVSLSQPTTLVFDELYYVRGAYSLMEMGYEGHWTGEHQAFAEGDYSGLEISPDFVVHPPLGKWIIAAGMRLFGPTPFGWRFSAAVVGTITVVLVALIAHHLFRSVVWGGVAGLFLAIDGEHLVLSRTALLDVFLTFFVVAAFGLLLLDRRRNRRRLEEWAARERERLKLTASDPIPGFGRSGVRWYRIAAVVTLGLAAGIKWSGLYFAAAFLALSLLWEVADRKRANAYSRPFTSFLRVACPLAVAAAVVLPATYVASYSSWFANENSYARNWAEEHPGEGITWLPEDARSFVAYHQKMWDFHVQLTRSNGIEHSYAARPWGFLVQVRPTAFYWETVEAGEGDPPSTEKYVAETIALGNPLLWWAGAVAFFYALWRIVRRFDLLAIGALSGTLLAFVFGPFLLGLAGVAVSIYALSRLAGRLDLLAMAVIVGTLGGWVPWMFYPDRVMFTFYSVAFSPWVMLALVWALRRIAQPPRLKGGVSRRGALAVGSFVALAVILAGFYLPLWTGQWIPYDYWHVHMPDLNADSWTWLNWI
jgi:dolichyl-phosphate-mannose-protein mannosyltransferase